MISIITPTYNREKLLGRLYSALIKQHSNRFEWIIIDDGSTDNTEEVVNKWIEENIISIKYIYQENRGKYIAHNVGVQNATKELCICIDSDDYPTDEFVKLITDFWEKNRNKKYSGIMALKCYKDGNIIGNKLPENLKEATLFYINETTENSGDKALVYRTEILRQHLFPEIKNTKFITESVIYDKIDCNYTMILMNKEICVCEYQNDGYSNNFRKLMINNPLGFNIYYIQRIDMALNLKSRLIYASKYYAFKWLSKNKGYKYEGKHKIIVNLSIIFGIVAYYYYKLWLRKFSNE